MACWFGMYEIVACLVKHKATININIKCKLLGMSPIHYAVCSENPSIVTLLCDHGADVNIIDNRKRTALHYVALLGSIEILRLLIKRKVEMEVPDENGHTPVDIVYESEEYDMLLIMTNNGADISKFYNEEWNGKLRKLKDNEDDDSDTSTSSPDFYGFYPTQKRKKMILRDSLKNSILKNGKQILP